MPQVIPFVVAAAGAVISSAQADQAGTYNKAVLERQARISQAQGFLDAESARRRANQVLGVQAASFSEAGGGLGGTAADVARQSAVNATLDEQNIQYGGLMRGTGLLAQAQQAKDAATAQGTSDLFMAGSNLLSGYGEYKKYKAGL
ncbi:MAG: hypothetical protein U1F35_05440 [Steroidobacteraceae bacterium]